MNAYYCKDWDGVDIYADRTIAKERFGKQEPIGFDKEETSTAFFKGSSFNREDDDAIPF